MIEIARSYSRKISLAEYGHPYEMVDLFASRKEELKENESRSTKNKVSDRLAEEARADVERQEKAVRAYFEKTKPDLDKSLQAVNEMKAKAKEHRKKSRDLQKKMKENPEKTAGEIKKGLPF